MYVSVNTINSCTDYIPVCNEEGAMSHLTELFRWIKEKSSEEKTLY